MSGFTLRVNKGMQTSTGHVFDMVLTSLMLSWTEPTTGGMKLSPCVSPFVAMNEAFFSNWIGICQPRAC